MIEINSTTDRSLRAEMARLCALKFAPKPPSANNSAEDTRKWAEISRVLWENCESLLHVRRVVDRIVNTLPEFPAPAEIRNLIPQVNPVPDRNSISGGVRCSVCEGRGLVVQWYIRTWSKAKGHFEHERIVVSNENEFRAWLAENAAKLTDQQDTVSAARPCGCRSISAEGAA